MLCRGNGCAHIIHGHCGNIAAVIASTIPHTYNKRKSKHGNGWVADTMTRRARTKGKEETALVQEERGGDSRTQVEAIGVCVRGCVRPHKGTERTDKHKTRTGHLKWEKTIFIAWSILYIDMIPPWHTFGSKWWIIKLDRIYWCMSPKVRP